MKKIAKIFLMGISVLAFTSCGTKNIKSVDEFGCKQDGEKAPKWTCVPEVDGYYASVGISENSPIGMDMRKKIAMTNGRSNLVQQIEVDVKDKMENFSRVTGHGDDLSLDKVTTSVTKQVSNMKLNNSKHIDQWTSKKGTLFLLVVVDSKDVNKKVLNNIKSSFQNDDALWQEYKSSQALKNLEEEFKKN